MTLPYLFLYNGAQHSVYVAFLLVITMEYLYCQTFCDCGTQRAALSAAECLGSAGLGLLSSGRNQTAMWWVFRDRKISSNRSKEIYRRTKCLRSPPGPPAAVPPRAASVGAAILL